MTESPAADAAHGRARAGLVLGALGVVFGDIGTSPLYTLRECIQSAGSTPETLRADVLGLVSLILWSLIVVVTIKYVAFIMQVGNKGQGGILALLALVPSRMRPRALERLSLVAVLVVVGAAFLYGDGAITPAITVLGAVEGIAVARPALTPWIVPLAVAILLSLFAIQRIGTGRIGSLFGPVMLVWFGTLAALGAWHISDEPSVLGAVSPHHAVAFFVAHGPKGFFVLGSVVLAITGGEALYADMGHFGRSPTARAWLFLVFPALVLAYLGQGALVLKDPSTTVNPFFLMVPPGRFTFALVLLSSVASVIASQALISGAFSLTRQAMQMGLFPRITVRHTAHEHEGQIFVPEVNALIALASIALVVVFKSSDALASAYGIAVTTTMTITSVVWYVVVRGRFRKRGWPVIALVLFLTFDLAFLGANLDKLKDGGYVPVLLGLAVTSVMLVWHVGRRLVGLSYTTQFASIADAWTRISKSLVTRVPGAGIFMSSSDRGVPPILVHLVERTHALPEKIVLVTVVTEESPVVEPRDRLRVETAEHGIIRVRVFYGFMEQPDVPDALSLAVRRRDLDVDLESATYYLARERVMPRDGELQLVVRMFSFLSRNAVNADRYFQIPREQVMEVGAQIEL